MSRPRQSSDSVDILEECNAGEGFACRVDEVVCTVDPRSEFLD